MEKTSFSMLLIGRGYATGRYTVSPLRNGGGEVVGECNNTGQIIELFFES
jgi:hypothetical protein